MNKYTVFFSTLLTITASLFSGEIDNKNTKKIIRGHMLPPMSPRTCQEYLESLREKENKKEQYPQTNKRYALRCSNEILLNRSGNLTNSTGK